MARRRHRRLHVWFWRVVNPPTKLLAGIVPWWVLLETTGRRSGRTRRVPVAGGPRERDGLWLNAVHGRHSAWVLNIDAEPAVRMRVNRRWRRAIATVHPPDPATAQRFNWYARGGPRTFGIDPLLVFVRWTEP